jgi:uncharacterized protein with HEPN domain
MRDPTLCLKDILRTMEAIESFVANMDFGAPQSAWATDKGLQPLVLCQRMRFHTL